jgi:gluconate 2-dehydrogenase gamma chain
MPRSRRARPLTRRAFIQQVTFFGGGFILLGPACDKEPGGRSRGGPRAAPGVPILDLTTSHKTFTDDEYRALAAACERILPKDQDPGATDADVANYIDNALQTPEIHKMREDMLGGIDALIRRSQRAYKKHFADATPEQQDELLHIFKDSPPESGEAHFYTELVTLTLEGFLGDPSYGGNKGRVGWTLVGFDTSEPPPGYNGMGAMHHHDHGER